MPSKKINEPKSIIIKGCGVRGCCPTVEYKGDEVFVRDDFNNTVKMTLQQWKDLVSAVVKRGGNK